MRYSIDTDNPDVIVTAMHLGALQVGDELRATGVVTLDWDEWYRVYELGGFNHPNEQVRIYVRLNKGRVKYGILWFPQEIDHITGWRRPCPE